MNTIAMLCILLFALLVTKEQIAFTLSAAHLRSELHSTRTNSFRDLESILNAPAAIAPPRCSSSWCSVNSGGSLTYFRLPLPPLIEPPCPRGSNNYPQCTSLLDLTPGSFSAPSAISLPRSALIIGTLTLTEGIVDGDHLLMAFDDITITTLSGSGSITLLSRFGIVAVGSLSPTVTLSTISRSSTVHLPERLTILGRTPR